MALITFSPNTKAKSSEVNSNFATLANGTNDTTGNSLATTRQQSFSNAVLTGMTIPTSASLLTTIAIGTAFVNGQYVTIGTTVSKTFGASADTYVDIKDDGTIVYIAVANGATTGFAITTNTDGTKALRLAKVVTSASAVTSVSQIGSDILGNILYPVGPTSAVKLQNPYKFSAYLSFGQTITASTWSKASVNTKLFDSGNNFDAVTNFRYTFPVNGYYYITGQVQLTTAGAGSGSVAQGAIYKNGSQFIVSGVNQMSGNANIIPTATMGGLYYFVAGDYIELYGYLSDTGRQLCGGSASTFMCAFLVSAT